VGRPCLQPLSSMDTGATCSSARRIDSSCYVEGIARSVPARFFGCRPWVALPERVRALRIVAVASVGGGQGQLQELAAAPLQALSHDVEQQYGSLVQIVVTQLRQPETSLVPVTQGLWEHDPVLAVLQ